MILLDTHVVIWLAFQPGKLSKRAKEVVRTLVVKADLQLPELHFWNWPGLRKKGGWKRLLAWNPSSGCALRG
jgi:hypothetical protein